MGVFIKGKNINLREIELKDADFSLSLRTNDNYNRHINPTSSDIVKQRSYIANKCNSENNLYFVVESKLEESLGTARLYNLKDDIFTFGSWIIVRDAPKYVALESFFLSLDYAYLKLNYQKADFDVRKANKSVVDFLLRVNCTICDEDDLSYFFSQSLEDYLIARKKYKKYTLESMCYGSVNAAGELKTLHNL